MKPKGPNQKAKYKALNARLNKYLLLVQHIYDTYNLEAAKIASGVDYDPTKPFTFAGYPTTKKRVQDLLESWSRDMFAVINTGTAKEWANSNEVQDLLADKVLSYYYGKSHGRRKRKYYQTNSDAFKAFQQRVDNGMTLSEKIWNQSANYKEELEFALSSGIQKGMSAVTLSKRVSKYLNDFDTLKHDYKEKYGKEVDCLNCEYRSMRLARSEINMAYRKAEQERWKQFDFVIGYEIKLSKSHHDRMPGGDICDDLKGKYPKDFEWTGWHPNDMCYAIPILKTEEEFFSDEPSDNEVTDVPEAMKEWIMDNQKRIENAKKNGTLSYWLDDNTSYISETLRRNKIALSATEIAGCFEMTEKQANQLMSDIRLLSKKNNMFGQRYSITFTNFKDGTLMEWKDDTLTVSSTILRLSDGTEFCPAKNLLNAIDKLKRKKTLEFNEEYSIECLFHESVHARATMKHPIVCGTMDEKICEACTQLYARDRYVKILNSYGVNPVNFEAIKYNGLGYQRECNLLRPFFEENGVLQIGELINIANETESGTRMILDKFEKLGIDRSKARKTLFRFLK